VKIFLKIHEINISDALLVSSPASLDLKFISSPVQLYESQRISSKIGHYPLYHHNEKQAVGLTKIIRDYFINLCR
jgi:hypothetical protein